MNMADQICGLMPRHSWEVEQKRQDEEDKHDGAAGGKTVSFGGPDEERDDQDVDVVVPEEEAHPFYVLPYSRASLKKKPKDHFPKLHAAIDLKDPEEGRLIINTTNPYQPVVVTTTTTTDGKAPKKSKDHKQCERNHF